MELNKDHFLVRPTSEEARVALIDYLESRGFTYKDGFTRESTTESIYPIIIDTASKLISHITKTAFAAASVKSLITETEFYEKYEHKR